MRLSAGPRCKRFTTIRCKVSGSSAIRAVLDALANFPSGPPRNPSEGVLSMGRLVERAPSMVGSRLLPGSSVRPARRSAAILLVDEVEQIAVEVREEETQGEHGPEVADEA